MADFSNSKNWHNFAVETRPCVTCGRDTNHMMSLASTRKDFAPSATLRVQTCDNCGTQAEAPIAGASFQVA